MQLIAAAVSRRTDPDTLVAVLQDLGRRHHGFGVQPQEHYSTVGQALLSTLASGLDSGYTPEVAAAWTEVYGVLTGVRTGVRTGVMQGAAVMA